jgi:prolipoprotein diacylglyceryltransferase
MSVIENLEPKLVWKHFDDIRKIPRCSKHEERIRKHVLDFAKKNGLDTNHIYNGAFWLILSAFIGARVVHVVFYDLAFYLANPSVIVKIWTGGFSVI